MTPVNSVTILVPIYNEAPVLPALFKRLQKLPVNKNQRIHFLFIDDGSKDNSALLIRNFLEQEPAHRGIFLSRNFGHAAALTAGLAAIDSTTDAVFIVDADLQDPPELLPEFMEKMERGNDVVYGIRTNRKESFFKRACYKAYYRLLRRFANIQMPLDAGDFALVSQRVVKHLNNMPEESRYMRGMRSWVGFSQEGLPYERHKRSGGESKYGYKELLKLAYNGIFNFSELPVRFIGITGFVSILIALVYLCITLYKKLVYGTVPEGFTALIFAIVLFSGVQLLSLSILGEYILRIFFQVKKRPIYIVKSKIVQGEEVYE